MRVDLATKHWAHKKQESSVYFETPEYRDLYSATPVIRPKGALQCVRLGSLFSSHRTKRSSAQIHVPLHTPPAIVYRTEEARSVCRHENLQKNANSSCFTPARRNVVAQHSACWRRSPTRLRAPFSGYRQRSRLVRQAGPEAPPRTARPEAGGTSRALRA